MSIFNKFFMSVALVSGVFVCTCLFNLSSATLDAATLTGIVTNENGDEIENAFVTAKRKNQNNMELSTVTDPNGFYMIDDLKFGNWKITASVAGHETESEFIQVKRKTGEVEKDFTLTNTDTDTEFVKRNNTNAIDAAVSSFNTIGTLRREDPINADKIASEYEGAFQDLTQQMDTEFGFGLNSDILEAIDDIKDSNEPKLAAQVIDKTGQRVFFLTVLDRITETRDDFDDSTTAELGVKWDEAYAAYQAISGTAGRDNKVLTEDRLSIETGSDPNLDDQITAAFINGKVALNKEDASEDEISIGLQRQVIRLSLARAFYIGVLREVAGIISNRDSDIEDARIKQKEGEVFYRIIESFVSRDNIEGNIAIKSQLTGSVSEVVADTIVSEMSRGFIGRAQSEVEANESKFSESDRAGAMIVAEEALLYSNVFIEDLELRLGNDKRDEIEDALKDLKKASSDNDESGADTARQTISSILTSYEDELATFEFVKTNDTEAIDSAVASFKTIGTLRREDPINADDIAAEYEGALQTLTQQMDTEFGFGLDSDILGAIEDIRNDNEPKLAAQVIDKTGQRVFFLTILDRITEVRDDFSDKTTEELGVKWDEAYAAFQAISGTAGRDNKVLTEDRLSIETGENPHLDNQIVEAFIRGKEDLNKENETEDKISIGLQRQVIRLSIARAFYIGVLREVEGIISNRDSDLEDAQIKQKEGEVFYSIIETFVSRDNPDGDVIIKAQLTGSVSDVVADTIVSEMSKGFIGRAKSEVEANESKFSESDREGAMIVAEEALLYSNVFLEDLELRLGHDQRDDMEDALKSLKKASNDTDESGANTAGQTITTILTSYENELL